MDNGHDQLRCQDQPLASNPQTVLGNSWPETRHQQQQPDDFVRPPLSILSTPPFGRLTRPSLPLLVVITMLGTMAMHVYIPAMPDTVRDLHSSQGMVQLTVTVYLIGLAIGQLLYGPLSDRFGRRPMLIAGLSLYFVASVCAALAQNVGVLIVARVFQSLGGCAGLVLGRAMVRDGSTSAEAARSLAILMTAMAIAPSIAPAVGAWVAVWGGWRANLALLAVFGAAVLMLSTLLLPETHRAHTPLPGIRPMLRSFARLLSLPAFRGYSIGGCCSSTSMYAYFSASPFIFTEVLHRPVQDLGIAQMFVAMSFAIGSFSSSRLLRRFGMSRVARQGNLVMLAGACEILLMQVTGQLNVFTFMPGILIGAMGSGYASPAAAAGAIGADPQAIGAASGLYGSMQMAFATLCTVIVSAWAGSPVTAVVVVLIGSTIVGQAALVYAELSARSLRL